MSNSLLESKNRFEIMILSDDNNVVRRFETTASIPVELDHHCVSNTVYMKMSVSKDCGKVVVRYIDVSSWRCVLLKAASSLPTNGKPTDHSTTMANTTCSSPQPETVIGSVAQTPGASSALPSNLIFMIEKENLEYCERYFRIKLQWIPPEAIPVSSVNNQPRKTHDRTSSSGNARSSNNDTTSIDYVIPNLNLESVVAGGPEYTYCFFIELGLKFLTDFTAVTEIPVLVDATGELNTSMTVIIPWRNSSTRDIDGILNFRTNDIVVYNGTVEKDIDAVVELVAGKQAAAILLLRRPSRLARLPVFIIEKKDMDICMLYPVGAKITLELDPLVESPLLPDVSLQDHRNISRKDGYQEQTTSETVDASWTSLLRDLCKYSESKDSTQRKQLYGELMERLEKVVDGTKNETSENSEEVRKILLLLLFLCQKPEEMVHLLQQLQNTHIHPVSYMNCFGDNLVEMIEKSLSSWKESREELRAWWEAIFKILEEIQFGHTKPWSVVDAIVKHSTFRATNSFTIYSTLYEALRPEHFFYDRLSKLLSENLCLDLEHLSEAEPTISSEEFLNLLHSRVGAFLLRGRGQDAIPIFARSSIKRLKSFSKSLDFIELLYAVVTASGLVPDPVPMACDLVRQARTNASQYIWLDAFSAAKADPELFGSDPALMDRIAEIIFPSSDGRLLLDDVGMLHRIFETDGERIRGPFEKHLQKRVQAILCESAVSIELASRFVSDLLIPDSNHLILEVAINVFGDAFSAWNPTTIMNIMAMTPNALDDLFHCIQRLTTLEEKWGKKLLKIITSWHVAFQEDAFTEDVLIDAVAISQKVHWQLLGSYLGIILPSEIAIAKRLSELEQQEEQILLYLSEPDGSSMSLKSILESYNCQPVVRSSLHRLLLEYDSLISSADNDHIQVTTVTQKSARQIRQDLEAVEHFRSSYGELIQICHYFLKTPSALFRKFMATAIEKQLDLDALNNAVKFSLATISDLIGATTSLKDVDDSVKTVVASGVTLEEELRVLAACSALKMTPEDRNRFQALVTMSMISSPLQNFVKFCHQYKFSAVNDSDFQEIERISSDLASKRVLGFHAETSFDRLAELLFLEVSHASGSLSIIQERRLPCIELLDALSSRSDIWTFVREMNWFGDDGLEKFSEEYGNVTKALLGNTASCEMSVLDALGPTVRTVSFVGSLQHQPKVNLLLESLERSSEGMLVCSSLQDDVSKHSFGVTLADLHQVQTNLSQIREWFTNRIDQIAAVSSELEEVGHTGKTFLHKDEDGIPIVSPRYVSKVNIETLEREDLTHFVQHVSLSQNEDDVIDTKEMNNNHSINTTGGGSSVPTVICHFTNFMVGAGAIGLGEAITQTGGIISILIILLFAYLAKVSLDLLMRLSVTSVHDSYDASGQAANEGLPTMKIQVPPPSSDLEQKRPWTYETLYQMEMNKPSKQLYGEPEGERQLRRWLNDHRLPQSVGDTLVEVGARDVEDVVMIMDQCKESLQDLKPLDLHKLKKAFETRGGQLDSEQARPTTISDLSIFRLILHRRDGTEITAFDAKSTNLLISDEQSREIVCDLKAADIWRNSDAAICDLSPYDSVANSTLFFAGDDPQDVYAVMQLAAQKKAVALLIAVDFLTQLDDGGSLPILIIERRDMHVCQQFAKDRFSGVQIHLCECSSPTLFHSTQDT